MIMAADKQDIYVYAHWLGMPTPHLMGVLTAAQGKDRQVFHFEYDPDWLRSSNRYLIDPDIGWYSGNQFRQDGVNFGAFLDSMPDRWGRTIMKRRAASKARAEGMRPLVLMDTDYLLGVYDESRLGGLRFKLDPEGPFLDHDARFPIPPWASVRDLQYAANIIESGTTDEEADQMIALLLAPGSSLGGARPKANILDINNHPWIAKFPSRSDSNNKGRWEYLAYVLATGAGIDMAPSKVESVAGGYDTFFTKRFDRHDGARIHFASAMTMLGYLEEQIRDYTPSYLEIAEFLQFNGAHVERNLHQLWRRMVFNISISNTDDHLRNHGLLLKEAGWELSPAFDLNPSTEKHGLSLNIDMDDNALDLDLARSVGEYFLLSARQMDAILTEVLASVRRWEAVALELGISRSERDLMAPAFRVSGK